MDDNKKKVYLERIHQYIDRTEQIKHRVQSTIAKGRVALNVAIDEDSTGHSYRSLFGKYLNADVKEIIIEESYLLDRYQVYNKSIYSITTASIFTISMLICFCFL